MGNIDIVGSIVDRKINKSMSLEGLVEFIKSPSEDHLSNVMLARSLVKGTPKYNSLKRNKIPCAILNFNHSKGYVRGNTVSKPTGYLYIDVDETLDIDLSSSYISAYWRSLSGTGYSIVVAVKGLTKKNYKSATLEVSDLLDLPLDKGAISIDRVTCISYDPKAYYNPEAEVYIIQSTNDTENYQPVITNNNSLYGLGLSDSFSDKVRLSTLNELYKGIDFNGEPVFDLGIGGRPYSDIHFGIYGVKEGSRNKVMYSTIQQLRALNPWMHRDRVEVYIRGINKKAFKPMLSNREVSIIIDSAFKIKNPKLMYNRTKRFLYNPDYDLTTKQKRSISMQILNSNTLENNNLKIKSVLQLWDFERFGKITLSKIAKQSNLSESSLFRRGADLKEIIRQKNLGFKNKK